MQTLLLSGLGLLRSDNVHIMSFAVTIIPTLGTSMTPWLADAMNTRKVY